MVGGFGMTGTECWHYHLMDLLLGFFSMSWVSEGKSDWIHCSEASLLASAGFNWCTAYCGDYL